jgi:hypothetical protein
MTPLLKLLARLYPSAWHRRYGAEFDALLEDRPPCLRDAFDILSGALKMQLKTRSFLQTTLACSLLGALIAAALSFTAPPQYLSQALILVNGSATNPATPPPNDFKPLLSILRTSTLDRDFLASLIQQKNLYPRERTRMPLDAVVDKMLHSITEMATTRAAPPASSCSSPTRTLTSPNKSRVTWSLTSSIRT